MTRPEVASLQQEPRAPVADPVRFAVYGPSHIAPGRPFVLDLWAFLAEQQEKVEGPGQANGRSTATGIGDRERGTRRASPRRPGLLPESRYLEPRKADRVDGA